MLLYCSSLGGLLLAVYIASVWPVLADQVSMCPPGRTMFVVGVVWLIELLFSVWTVAYNFVPGGEYTRERTILLVVASILCIGLALFTGNLRLMYTQLFTGIVCVVVLFISNWMSFENDIQLDVE